jgi:hypothetical protein
VVCAGGRPATDALAQKLIYYDGVADKWESVVNPFATAGGHIYSSQAISVSHRRFFYAPLYSTPLQGRVIHEWNLTTNQFSRTLDAPPQLIDGNNAQWGIVGLCWHPDLGSAGSLLYFGAESGSTGKMARYDWATQQWVAVFGSAGNFLNGHCVGVYVPAARAVLCGKSNPVVSDPRSLTVVNADGSHYQTAVANIDIGPTTAAGGAIAAHPTRRAAVIYERRNWGIYTYEFDSDEFVYRGAIPAALRTVNLSATTLPSVNAVLLVAGTNSEPVAKYTYVHKLDF